MNNPSLLAQAVITDAMRNARKGSARDLLWLVSPDADLYLQLAHIERQELRNWISRLLVIGVPPLPNITATTDYSEGSWMKEREEFEERIEKRHAEWKKNFMWKERYGKREQVAETEPRYTSKTGRVTFTADATSETDR